MQTETKVMIGVAVASVLILIGGAYIYTKSSAPAANLDPNNPALVGNKENIVQAPNEKVLLIEYGDFECPACAAANPYLEQLLSEYKDTVTYEWRTFPLHSHSVLASRAAFIVKELSGDPQKFFAMGNLLFTKQDEWATESGATNQEDLFAGYAETLGVDPTKFKEILNTNKYEDVVERDRQDAVTIGTNVTPSFYINGVVVQGFDADKIKSLIDKDIQQ